MSIPAGFDNTPKVAETIFTLAELEVWTQNPPGSLAADEFAQKVIWGASLVVREAGSLKWNVNNVPERARLIAILLAKAYYLNPTGNRSETIGPLSEGKAEAFIRDLNTLTDAEKVELALLAGKRNPVGGGKGFYVVSFDEGAPEEPDDLYVTDQSGTDWMIPLVRLGDHLYPREL